MEGTMRGAQHALRALLRVRMRKFVTLERMMASKVTQIAPIVEVIWEDAASPHVDQWEGLAEARKFNPPRCRAVGYLIEKTPQKLVLVGLISTDLDVGMKFVLPRGCVREVRMLEVKK